MMDIQSKKECPTVQVPNPGIPQPVYESQMKVYNIEKAPPE
jgi:hypothetical protein